MSEQAKHTPGPLDWMFVGAKENGHVYLIDANNRKIASMWGKGAEKIANANLYAAAPDMLAALKLAEWGGLDWDEHSCPVCSAPKDGGRHEPNCVLANAIAKAEAR